MRRWIIFHLPEVASAMIALVVGFPVALAGRTRYTSSAGWSRGRSTPPLKGTDVVAGQIRAARGLKGFAGRSLINKPERARRAG